MKIPANNQWTQYNRGDIFGALSNTKSIDLQTNGKLILTRKSSALWHEDVLGDMTYALAIVYYVNDYIIITTNEGQRVALTSSGGSTISSYPGGVANNSDAVICYGRLYISLDTNLSYWDGSSWTSSIKTLTTNEPHPLEVFDSLTTYKLAVANGNTVSLIDSAGNSSSTVLTLPAQFRITTLRYRNGYLYVGTRHRNGGEARVFIWDGNTNNANYEVPVGAPWVFSMTAYQGSVAFITDRGQLFRINGTSAEEIAVLPVFGRQGAVWQDNLGLQLNGKVFNRGMMAVDDKIYINIDGTCDLGTVHEMRSGLWIYDPALGLYHHAQASNDRMRADSTFSVSDSVITTTATHYLKTGDAVEFTSITGLTGVKTGRKYYVTVIDADSFKISLSRKAVKDARYVTIGGSVSSETLIYFQNRDFGSQTTHTSGAICYITSEETIPETMAGKVLYGSLIEDLDGTNKYTVQVLHDSYNVGQFTTSRIYSDNISQVWKDVYAFIDGLRQDNEEVIVKYRTDYEEQSLVMEGTWLSETVINSDPTRNDEDDFDEIEIGDEVYFVDGYGRGHSAHVIGKTQSTTITSIEIDESIGTANKTVSFYRTNFKKVKSYTNERVEDSYIQIPLHDANKSAWVQFKFELRGFQTAVNHLELTNSVNKSAV